MISCLWVNKTKSQKKGSLERVPGVSALFSLVVSIQDKNKDDKITELLAAKSRSRRHARKQTFLKTNRRFNNNGWYFIFTTHFPCVISISLCRKGSPSYSVSYVSQPPWSRHSSCISSTITWYTRRLCCR